MTRRERMEARATALGADVVADMREWVLDCAVDETDAEDIADALDWKIVSYVDRNYDGGIPGFLECTPVQIG